MIRRRVSYNNFCLRIVILLLPVLAFAIAATIRFRFRLVRWERAQADLSAYLWLLLLTTAVWAIVSEQFGLCRLDQLFAAGGKTRRLLTACAITYASIMTVTFFERSISFSRVLVLMSAVLLVLLAWIARVGFRVLLDHERQKGRNHCRVLLVGTDEIAARVRDSLVKGQVMPCRVVGFVRLPGQQVAVRAENVLELDQISNLAVNNGIDDAVIAVPLARLAEIPALLPKLESLCVPIRAVLDFGDGILIRDKLFDFGGTLMLDLHATPAESIRYLFLKRAFDIVFSLIVIILTAPLMGAIVLTIRLTSRGPVLFVQDRVGLNGKIFRMYKFRTMEISDPKESDMRWTVPNDPRRTKLGALLRRMNLDELPQFFNVLTGDMSVVGPRPERPYFVQKFLREVALYNTRHYFKVGVTGWAQVNGLRGDTSIEKRLEYDLYYLRNWNLTFDLQIILLTLLRGFSSANAY